jgi:hypothetical protein
MKLFFKAKDGGQESTVTGYWLIESKSLFSIAILRFDGMSRNAYHSHAFNSISWLLSGMLIEGYLNKEYIKPTSYFPSLIPIITKKSDIHMVHSMVSPSWVLTFRGPWESTWIEHTEKEKTYILTHGRKRVK